MFASNTTLLENSVSIIYSKGYLMKDCHWQSTAAVLLFGLSHVIEWAKCVNVYKDKGEPMELFDLDGWMVDMTEW